MNDAKFDQIAAAIAAYNAAKDTFRDASERYNAARKTLREVLAAAGVKRDDL